MLINYVPGEESRIAIVEDGKLEEFYHERAANVSHVNNIYQGVVTNVEPAIQAAFVDFGLEQNGFLHVTDVHPKYFPGADEDETEKIGSKTKRRERPPIERCFKRGSKVLVQVIKEGVGTKGPTVTSYCSIPGRFLVMMPDMERHGVSRKTEDEDERKEMRDILKALSPPDGFGFIVRTAGLGQTKTDLKRDLAYLLRLWKEIDRKRKSLKTKTGELYAESDLVIRTLRDVFTPNIERVIVDNPDAAQRAHEFLAVANPRSKTKVILYQDPVPLYHRFDVERQIETIGSREVPLPSGGALVIDPTEALVAIDVNSGKSRKARDAETNAYQTNQEAVDEIARQLRLRDLGGLVVLDLIDMMQAKHRKAIENRLKNLLKDDRARTRVGGISQFGMLEMTRQRMRPSITKAVYQECSVCAGQGYVKSAESTVLSVMRGLALAMHRKDAARIELTISPDVAFQILNRKRAELVSLETRHGKPVTVRVGGGGRVDYLHIAAFNASNVELVAPGDNGKAIAPPTETTFRELSRADLADLLDELEALEAEQDAETASQVLSEAAAMHAEAAADIEANESQPDGEGGKKKRRRRRGGRRRRTGDDDHEESDAAEAAAAPSVADPAKEVRDERDEASEPDEPSEPPAKTPEASHPSDESGEASGKKKRRRRRRKRNGDPAEGAEGSERSERSERSEADATSASSNEPLPRDEADAPDPESRKSPSKADATTEPDDHHEAEAASRKKKRRRRRRGKSAEVSDGPSPSADAAQAAPDDKPSRGYANTVIEERA